MSQYEIMKLIREGRTNGFIGPSENLKHYPDYIKNMDDVYKFSKMICTDDSDLQFGIEIEEGRWEYTQIANRRLYDLFTNYPQEFCKAYDEKLWINGINVRYECYLEYAVVSELIYLDKYSDEEIEDIIAPYRYTLLPSKIDDNLIHIKEEYPYFWKQLCCECIFEDDCQMMIVAYLNDLDGPYGFPFECDPVDKDFCIG